MNKKKQEALNQAKKQIENAKKLTKEAEKKAKEARKKAKEARKKAEKAEKTPGEDVYCKKSKKSPSRKNNQISIVNEVGSVNYGKQIGIQEITCIEISNKEEIEIDIDLNE